MSPEEIAEALAILSLALLCAAGACLVIGGLLGAP